jgi:glutamate carboxypeptidase
MTAMTQALPTQVLSTAAHALEPDYLATLEALVALESPTHDKPLVDLLMDHLAALLTGRGWAVERSARETVGDVLVARKAGGVGPRSLLLSHGDTVWPPGTLARMPFRRDGDRVYGPGVLDMKAGIVTALYAVSLAERNGDLRGPVTLLVSSDEEVGSRHSRALIEELAAAHDRVFVLEPGKDDGALKVGRKGVGDFQISFLGRSAHAGNNPELGASALRELAHFLLFAEALNDPEASTSVNLTVAHGGSVGNVIAEAATASVDFRALRLDEAARVEGAVRSYVPHDPRIQVTVEGGLNRPPLEPTPANLALFEEAKALGCTCEGAVVGGASDGNFTSALGVPTLDGLGSVGEGPHARHEHIRLRETLERVGLLAALLSGAAP